MVRRLFNYTWSIFLDLFALLGFIFFYCLDLTKSNPAKKERSRQRPILLVHGYMHNSSGWLFFRRHLTKAGFQQIHTINLGQPFASLEDHIITLKKKVAEIASLTQRNDIVLIGHSMGGLLCAYYASHVAEPGTVTEVVTIGSPLGGTKVGVFGIGEDCREMRYHSTFIKNFQAQMRNDIHYLHIWSPADLIVVPHDSAYISGFPNHQNKEIVLGHLSLLYSKRVANETIRFLS